MANNASRPLRTIKPSAGTPTVSRAKLTQAARSVSRSASTGRFTSKGKSSVGSALSQRSVIKPAKGRSRSK